MTDSFAVVVRELADVFLTEAELLRELLEAVLFPRDEALRLLLNTSGLLCSERGMLLPLSRTPPLSVAATFPPVAPTPLSPLPPPLAVESGDVWLLALSSKYSSGQLRK